MARRGSESLALESLLRARSDFGVVRNLEPVREGGSESKSAWQFKRSTPHAEEVQTTPNTSAVKAGQDGIRIERDLEVLGVILFSRRGRIRKGVIVDSERYSRPSPNFSRDCRASECEDKPFVHYILSLGLFILMGPSAFARDIALLVHSYPPSRHAKFSFELHRRRFLRALAKRSDLTPMAIRAYSRTELRRRIDRLDLESTDRITHLMFTGDGSPLKVGGLDFDDLETWTSLAALKPFLAADAAVAFIACQFLSPGIDKSTRDAEALALRFEIPEGRLHAFHGRLEYPFDTNLFHRPWGALMSPERWATGVEQSFVLLAAVSMALFAGDHGARELVMFGGVLGGYVTVRQLPQVIDRRRAKAFRFELNEGRVVSYETLSFRDVKRRFVEQTCNRSLAVRPP